MLGIRGRGSTSRGKDGHPRQNRVSGFAFVYYACASTSGTTVSSPFDCRTSATSSSVSWSSRKLAFMRNMDNSIVIYLNRKLDWGQNGHSNIGPKIQFSIEYSIENSIFRPVRTGPKDGAKKAKCKNNKIVAISLPISSEIARFAPQTH